MQRNLVLILLVASLQAYSQDLVVTSDGDSLNCKITAMKNDTVYFDVSFKGVRQSYLLLASDARAIEYGYFKPKAVPASKKEPVSGDPVPRYSSHPDQRWHFSAFVGYSYRLGAIPPGLPSSVEGYLQKLKSGYNLGGQLNYGITESIQVGVLYHGFNSSNSNPSLPVTTQGGSVVALSVSDDISIHYIGPVLTTLFAPGNKGVWLFDVTLGSLQYQDWAVEGTIPFRLEGSTLGYGFGFGYEGKLSTNWSLGAKLFLTFGRIKEFTLYSGGSSAQVSFTGDYSENLARLDFTVFVQFSR